MAKLIRIANQKLVSYSVFLVASVLVVLAFITSKNYVQLIGASILYLPLGYWAMVLFSPGKFLRFGKPLIEISLPKRPRALMPMDKRATSTSKDSTVVDLDRRAFLKLIGATGISFFLFSLIGRRVEGLLFGQSTVSAPISSSSTPVGTSGTDLAAGGYRISEFDDGEVSYFGFTKSNGSWLIMRQDPVGGTFRYVKGDGNFPNSWSRRRLLNYDYFHNLF